LSYTIFYTLIQGLAISVYSRPITTIYWQAINPTRKTMISFKLAQVSDQNRDVRGKENDA
jgi:hypothetical protein